MPFKRKERFWFSCDGISTQDVEREFAVHMTLKRATDYAQEIVLAYGKNYDAEVYIWRAATAADCCSATLVGMAAYNGNATMVTFYPHVMAEE